MHALRIDFANISTRWRLRTQLVALRRAFDLEALLVLQALIVLLTCGGYLTASSLLILLNKYLMVTDHFDFPLMLSGSGMVVTLAASSALVQSRAIVRERQVSRPHMPVHTYSQVMRSGLSHAVVCALSLAITLSIPPAQLCKSSKGLPYALRSCAILYVRMGSSCCTALETGDRGHACLQTVSREDYLRRILPLGFCSAATLALGNIAYLYLDVGLLQMLKSCCPVFVLLVAIAFRLERCTLPLVASICFIAVGTATTAASGAQSHLARAC